VDRDDLTQPLGHPGEAVEVRAGAEAPAVDGEQPLQRGQGGAVERVGHEQRGDVAGERGVQVAEPLPRGVPGVPLRHGQRDLFAAVVVAADLVEADEVEPTGIRLRVRGRAATQATEQLVPDGGEGDERRACVDALAVQLDAPALPAHGAGGLEQRHAVAGVGEQGGCREPPEARADDDDAAHG